MKVIVVQHGARHRYMVATILWQNNVLEALYTDSTAYSICGRIATLFSIFGSGRLKRLSARKIDGIPLSKIFSTDRVLWSDSIAKLLRNEASWEVSNRRHEIMTRVMKRWGIQTADIVYAMQDEGNSFLRYAKHKGLRIVVDICVTPLAHRITQAECKMFPEWESPIDDTELKALEGGMRENLLLADMVLCPSEMAAQDAQAFANIPSERCRVVPYGSSIARGSNDPTVGNVLYVGAAILRKGIHYLAKASTCLCGNADQKYDFRVAGSATDSVRQRTECSKLKFLGKLQKKELSDEYSTADVFVLPTLAEGLPAVVLEAMSYGVPIITTAAAGVEFKDGVNGVIVPERNAEALAEAIKYVISNREFRKKLSRGAQELASEYTASATGERLLRTLLSLDDPQ